jgi:dUTP pyrophosphatase
MQPLEIKIKYFVKDIDKIKKIEIGDWIDLRSSEDITLKKGDHKFIPLGIGMKLPEEYEAYIVPRSSTFKNFKIIQTNHIGIIDNSYSGEKDEWKFSAYATEDIFIPKNSRICQFRINKKQPEVFFTEIEFLDDKSRGGFGSTGI